MPQILHRKSIVPSAKPHLRCNPLSAPRTSTLKQKGLCCNVQQHFINVDMGLKIENRDVATIEFKVRKVTILDCNRFKKWARRPKRTFSEGRNPWERLDGPGFVSYQT
jgi:hypothetical protein